MGVGMKYEVINGILNDDRVPARSRDHEAAAGRLGLMRLRILLRMPVQLANMFIEVGPGPHLETEWNSAAAVTIHKQARPGTTGAVKPMHQSPRTQNREHASWLGFSFSIHLLRRLLQICRHSQAEDIQLSPNSDKHHSMYDTQQNTSRTKFLQISRSPGNFTGDIFLMGWVYPINVSLFMMYFGLRTQGHPPPFSPMLLHPIERNHRLIRALVADDDAVCRRVVSSALSTMSCEVMEVSNGTAALACLRAQPFDLCVLDWEMPEVSGLQVCESVRTGSALHRPYLMLLSSNYGTDFISRAKKAGADEYMAKPVDPETLRNRVLSLKAALCPSL